MGLRRLKVGDDDDVDADDDASGLNDGPATADDVATGVMSRWVR